MFGDKREHVFERDGSFVSLEFELPSRVELSLVVFSRRRAQEQELEEIVQWMKTTFIIIIIGVGAQVGSPSRMVSH